MPPACGRERWYAVPRGGRDLRFETADYQTAEFCYPLSAVRFPREGVRLQTGMVLGNVFPIYGWTHGAGRFLDCASLRSK